MRHDIKAHQVDIGKLDEPKQRGVGVERRSTHKWGIKLDVNRHRISVNPSLELCSNSQTPAGRRRRTCEQRFSVGLYLLCTYTHSVTFMLMKETSEDFETITKLKCKFKIKYIYWLLDLILCIRSAEWWISDTFLVQNDILNGAYSTKEH